MANLGKKAPPGAKGQAKPSSSLQDFPMASSDPGDINDAAMRRMKAESALHVLTQAEEHRRNKPLMKDVKKLAKERMSHLVKVSS